MDKLSDTFIIGRKPVLDALDSNSGIEKVWIDSSIKGELEVNVRKMTKSKNIPLQYVPKEKLQSLSNQANHQGLIAQISIVDYVQIEQVLPHLYESGKTPFILVLDGIEDVRNIGALARSAVWFDVDAIVVSSKNSARINSFAMKSSAGAIKDVVICREPSIVNALKYMSSSGLQILVADSNENQKENKINYKEPLALVMGSEGKGVVREVLQLANAVFTIPGSGKVESLNVSVAGAIMMHTVFTQRIDQAGQ